MSTIIKKPKASLVSVHKEYPIPVIFENKFKLNYIKHIKNVFNNLTNYLQKIPDNKYSPEIKPNVINRVKKTQEHIIRIINEYFSGHPANSYRLFENMVEELNLRNDLLQVSLTKVDENNIFFRARTISESDKHNLESIDLFHVPFEKRIVIQTNRFSISGFPSLYLSKNLYTSFSECYPNSEKGLFCAIGLQNIRPLYFIDLTDDNFKNLEESFKKVQIGAKSVFPLETIRIIQMLVSYQMIIASHTKIKYLTDEKVFFKPEYIIPQLLLQWLQQNGIFVDGIKYKSCTSQTKFPNYSSHTNYILPAHRMLNKGYCPSLVSIFKATKVFYSDKNRSILSTLRKTSGEIKNASFEQLGKL